MHNLLHFDGANVSIAHSEFPDTDTQATAAAAAVAEAYDADDADDDDDRRIVYLAGNK